VGETDRRKEAVFMGIVDMLARSPKVGVLPRVELTAPIAELGCVLKGIGSTTKGSYHIIECLFDIFNDLHEKIR